MKQLWPDDAIMIVACRKGDENEVAMDGKVPGVCRECLCAVTGDTHTFQRALDLPGRRGRPVLYFCVECATQKYDMNTITLMIDDRGHPVRACSS